MQKPKRPLMHTNIHGSSWINRSAGPMSLEDWARASEYFFSHLKKSAPAHPRRGRCSQNKSVMLSISNLTPVWVCKGMKIWQDTIRYVEVCLSLSLDDSLSGGSSSTCSGASASRRLTIRGLVLWESNRGNVRENGEITVAQCLVDPRWPKKWHWCVDVAKHY